MQETNIRLGIGFIVIFLYMLIGAMVFVKIESPLEQTLFDEYDSLRSEWELKLAAKGFDSTEIDNLFANVKYMAEMGIWREQNVTADYSWSYGRAFFFAGALLTTIGYGNVSPRTPHGKLFTIIFCVVGIPMTLALLSALTYRIRYPSTWLRKQLNVHLGHLFHAIHLQWIHLMVVCILLFIVAFLIPSMIFMSIETDWGFIDAIYFCFVSLSTIGLGDYTPGDQPNQPYRGFYKFLVTVYLLFGLSCMMLFLATLYDIPQMNLTRFFVTKSDNLNDDDDDDDTEIKPIHMSNGGPKYTKYNGDDNIITPSGNHSSTNTPLPYTAVNGFYQQ
uniref:Two pore potassium channel protein sup-9 n=1 Tax=Panagrolaimus davidi TaxID=227884 RepID=A0A914NXU8_9BILA